LNLSFLLSAPVFCRALDFVRERGYSQKPLRIELNCAAVASFLGAITYGDPCPATARDGTPLPDYIIQRSDHAPNEVWCEVCEIPLNTGDPNRLVLWSAVMRQRYEMRERWVESRRRNGAPEERRAS
jgi:hypothetical protein